MRIIISLLLTIGSVALWAQKPNSSTYIIHEVKAKETLYSISRAYNIPINSIIALNASVEDGLDIGQKVKIPQLKPIQQQKVTKNTHVVKAKETFYSISKMYRITTEELQKWNKKTDLSLSIGEELIVSAATVKTEKSQGLVIDAKGKKVHVVKGKETLYSISRLYAVTSEDLMHWNKLKNNELSIGKVLIVGVEHSNVVVKEATENITVDSQEVSTPKEAPIVIKKESKPEAIEVFEDDKPRKVKNASGFEEIVQTGLAELIDGTTDSRKYLALHASARVGTIMKVRNEMNNQMVFVRVIGKIPATGDNEKILIKLSNAAYNRLGALDKRFRVEVSYMP